MPTSVPERFTVPEDEFEDIALSRTRRTIAEHMTRSLQTAAQLTSVINVDMTRIADLRSDAKGPFEGAHGVRLSYMPFIVAGTSQTLRAYPEFNAHMLEGGKAARLFRDINVGIAVGRNEGLIVPVLKAVDMMTFTELAKAIDSLGKRAHTKGGLTLEDVTGGTFTLSNYGAFGAILDTPIIAQPQVAILGIGAIEQRPGVERVKNESRISVRHQMYLSLTYDHRWIDGHRAAQFNAHLKHALEEPGRIELG